MSDSTSSDVKTRKESAGLLFYRTRGTGIEVLIAHPGGPFWASKDEGAWSFPKGELEAGEEPLTAAIREFTEETGVHVARGQMFLPLGTVTLRSGKVVHAWAVEGDMDPNELTSNTFSMRWPPGSDVTVEFPEIDRVAWVEPEEAIRCLNPALEPLVTRLLAMVGA